MGAEEGRGQGSPGGRGTFDDEYHRAVFDAVRSYGRRRFLRRNRPVARVVLVTERGKKGLSMKDEGEANTASTPSEVERKLDLILRALEGLAQEVRGLRETLERREDLAQEIGEIKDDVRYLLLAPIDALEDLARHARATLRARAHLEGRPDLDIATEAGTPGVYDRRERWGEGADGQ